MVQKAAGLTRQEVGLDTPEGTAEVHWGALCKDRGLRGREAAWEPTPVCGKPHRTVSGSETAQRGSEQDRTFTLTSHSEGDPMLLCPLPLPLGL